MPFLKLCKVRISRKCNDQSAPAGCNANKKGKTSTQSHALYEVKRKTGRFDRAKNPTPQVIYPKDPRLQRKKSVKVLN